MGSRKIFRYRTTDGIVVNVPVGQVDSVTVNEYFCDYCKMVFAYEDLHVLNIEYTAKGDRERIQLHRCDGCLDHPIVWSRELRIKKKQWEQEWQHEKAMSETNGVISSPTGTVTNAEGM